MTKISIILPFFNSESTLKRAIDSVISQSFSDLELILVNDGSYDQSDNIAKYYLKDKRVFYIIQTNKGVSAARNLGATKAKGDWLVFLDSDDALRQGILTKMKKAIMAYPDNDYFHFGICFIKERKNKEILPTSQVYLPKLAGSFLLKKKVFDKVGGYDEKLKFSENTELFHRIHLSPVRFKRVPLISLKYYQSKNGGSRNVQNILEGILYILNKHANSLSHNIKFLYHQSAGVIYIRFQDLTSARYHFKKALRFKPWKLATWARLFLTFVPFLAKRIYKIEIYIV